MATLQNTGGSAPALPNQTTSTIDPVLEAAAFEAGQHLERAAAIAERLGISTGRWLSSAEMAEVRRVFVLSGQHPDDGPLASAVIGPVPSDTEGSEPREEYYGEDFLRAGELAPIVSTAHHEALTYLRRWSDLDGNGRSFPYGDMVSEHMTYLAHSPAFRSFLEEAKAPDALVGDPNWNIVFFGAQMFAAGLLAARREFGRRPPTPFDLELDLVSRSRVSYADVKRCAQGLDPIKEGFLPIAQGLATTKGGAR